MYGGELWLALHPHSLKGFNASASVATVYGINKNPAFHNKGRMGEFLPLIPPLKIVTTISQAIDPGSGFFSEIKPLVEIETDAAQDRYLGVNQTEAFTPGYTLVNAGLSAKMKLSDRRSFSLVLHINNAFNKAYQSHLSRLKYFEHFTDSPDGRLGIYNMGRNVSMKLVMPF